LGGSDLGEEEQIFLDATTSISVAWKGAYLGLLVPSGKDGSKIGPNNSPLGFDGLLRPLLGNFFGHTLDKSKGKSNGSEVGPDVAQEEKVGERLTLRRTRLKTTVHDSFRGFFR
jgi:hypothetical protein